MVSLNTQTFTALLQTWVASVQSAAAGLVDFTIGSILRAMGEADSLVALWLQGLILQLLATTRAATSSGSDLDSWIADFAGAGFRLPPVASSGQLTFARRTTTLQASVAVGYTAQTPDGTQVVTVTRDPANAAYSSALDAYVIAAGTTSVTVPAVGSTAGSASNVVAGAVSVITSALAGIDTVTNASAFTGGLDAELDPPLRVRFVAWLLSLASGTAASIQDAILNIQQGATCFLVENLTYAGATLYGYGYAVVDDGTGSPSTSFLNACQAAVLGKRAFGIRCDVFAVVALTANWAMSLTVKGGYTAATVQAAVVAAETAYIAALPQATTLSRSALIQVAMETAGVANVNASTVTINGATADLACTSQQRVKAGSGTVSTS